MNLLIEDFRTIVGELERMFIGKVESPQWTLTGELITNPYPVIRDRGKVIRGIPIRIENFHRLEVKKHSRKVLSVDASLKILFDCGTFQIALAKVSCSIWRGRQRIYEVEPIIRAKLVKSRLEAMEFLFKVEVESAISAASRLSRGDYCILDRPLIAIPAYKEDTRRILDRLCEYFHMQGVRLIGVTKASKLEVNTGESLLGFLLHKSSELFADSGWYYYPIFRLRQYPKWYLGAISIVKFSHDTDHIFRVDINRRDVLDSTIIGEYLSEVAYLQDPATPGYPYPLKSCHEEAKIGRQELAYLRLTFLESLNPSLRARFISNLKSTSFKEEKLWEK
ncbi:MAG: DNA double-strand break repair nuclease NurA [archaeon GB-1867-005]|nr:DNA double-strand break repair nuclease NurA [Candidatus Culexmicrobium cathedralense]